MKFLILRHKRRLEQVGDEHATLAEAEAQARTLAKESGTDDRFSVIATNGSDIAALVAGSRRDPEWARFTVDLSKLR